MLYVTYMTLIYVLLMTVHVVGMNGCVLGGVCIKLADLGYELLGLEFLLCHLLVGSLGKSFHLCA